MKGLTRKLGRWIEDRTGLWSAFIRLARHPVPPKVGWAYVFGSATLTAFLLQVVTGITLATAYTPSTGEAYQSLEFITDKALLGNFLRGLHFFGASAMVVLIGIHMIRVFLHASYKYPREVSWISGVVLLGLTLAMGFTGQLLRWDQNAVWSLVVGAEQAGRAPFIGKILAHFLLAGNVVGGATLTRFFAFHVFFLPALIFGFVGLHLYLVLHNGISEPPAEAGPVDPATYRARYEERLEREGKPFFPHAAWRDIAFGAGVILVVGVLAALAGPPPLGRPPDPTIIQADPRPDWYLLWYFAVLALLPHGTEKVLIVLLPLLAGVVLLAVPFLSNRGERRPSRRPWAVLSVVAILTMVGSLTILGYQSPWSPDFSPEPLPDSVVSTLGPQAATGAHLFRQRGCQNCHTVAGVGGRRGPELTLVADRLTRQQMVLRILNGGNNMPAFASILKPREVDALVAFLETLRAPGTTDLPRDDPETGASERAP